MDPNAFRYNSSNPIVLDFSKCKYVGEIHCCLKEVFGFPEYYGKNWSALWDCIDGYFEDDETRTIIVKGFKTLPDDLQEFCKPMWEIFGDIHKQCNDVVFINE